MENDIVKLQKIGAAVDKIRKARTNLLLSSPFFGQFSILPVLEPSHDFDGLATDGKTLYFNPDFVVDQSFDELKTRMANIVIKPALKHHIRRGERRQKLWVDASDYAANDVLQAFGFRLPDDLKFNHSFHNQSAESIYSTLRKQQMEKEGDGQGDGDQEGQQNATGGAGAVGENNSGGESGQTGNRQRDGSGLGNSVILDGPQQSEAEKRLEEAKWNAALKSAAAAARACGQGSSALDRFVEEAIAKQLPWKEILARFLTMPAKKKIDWGRPSRKMVPFGFFFATRCGKEMEDPVLIVDTSGSISDEDLNLVGGQAHALAGDMECGLHVIYVDAEVMGYQYIDSTAYPPKFKLEAKGGGGTDFRPGFEYVGMEKIYPPVAIYLTDGYCNSFPDKVPEYDVLWILTAENRGFKPPFGEVIHINQ